MLQKYITNIIFQFFKDKYGFILKDIKIYYLSLDCCGMANYDKGEIYINHELNESEKAITLVHEIEHLYQEYVLKMDNDEDFRENDAIKIEQEFMDYLLAS